MPKCASCLWWKEKESYYFEGETQEDNIGLYLFWCKPTYFFLINLGTLSSKIKSVFFFLYYLHILLAQTGTFTPPPPNTPKEEKKTKKTIYHQIFHKIQILNTSWLLKYLALYYAYMAANIWLCLSAKTVNLCAIDTCWGTFMFVQHPLP